MKYYVKIGTYSVYTKINSKIIFIIYITLSKHFTNREVGSIILISQMGDRDEECKFSKAN